MLGRRTTTLLLFLVLAASRHAQAQTQNIPALRQAVIQAGGRVIVTLKSTRGAAIRAPGSPPVSADELNTVQSRLQVDYPVQVQAQVPLIGALVATMSDADVARLALDPNVADIEPDTKTYLTNAMSHTIAGPVRNSRPGRIRADVIPWGVADVGAPAAWASGITGAGVKVGIMDTGIDYTHPDLNVVGGYDFTTSSAAASAYNDNFPSCDGHGTHVAGTVAARQNGSGVVGVAPGASLYALKVFTDFGSGCFAYLSAQVLALQWAVTNGLDVVSISIGNSVSSIYATAITNANAAGVVVVAAAGNGGGPGVTYPAAAPGAIAVSALDAGNTLAGYSSYGPELWLAAPGSSVESTIPGGGTGFKSGTSMATPHVTGVVALIRQAHPTWSAAQVAAELKKDATDLYAPGFDNTTGWGLVQAPIAGGVTPVTIAVSPAARSVSVQQGSAAASDNAAITLAGTNAGTTAWTATKKKAWITLTTAAGSGSGTVAWSRNTTGLAVGTYVDTITVSTAVTAAVMVFDTLKITAATIPVTVAISPAARSVSTVQGGVAPGDNATVTLAGTNALSTAWSATKKKTWLTLTAASGTGSGTVAWTRNATGLAVGTYVDTITVSTAVTAPVTLFDTLRITAAAIPVTITVSPAVRGASVPQGTAAPGDNSFITLAGTNASTTAWTASKKSAWLTLTIPNGIGTGNVAWTRNSTGLAVGTYVDTITIATAVTASVTVIDTLKITAGAIPVTITVSPAVRSASVQQGGLAPGDNSFITLAGTNASSTAWTATKKKAWLTLTIPNGTGTGNVAWTRNATGLAVGTYVDTITIATAVTAPVTVFDTLKITAATIPVTITVSPAVRSASAQQGTAAPGDNSFITLAGTNGSTTAWTATNRKPWLTLTIPNGTGTGNVAWTRNTAGLVAGTYVDTITISTAVTGSVTVFDTLRITASPVPVSIAVNPIARSVSVQQGNVAPGDNASVTVVGTNASSTQWSATKLKPWLTLTSASGTGSGTVAWTRSTAGLGVGVYVDTITVSTAVTGPVTVFDTLRITAAPIPVTIAVSPGARSVSVQQGNAAPPDNAAVTLAGSNAAATQWLATNRQPWLSLATASGTGSGTAQWTRSATGLAVGTYVDTITVVASGTGAAPAILYDTLRITAAPIAVTVAVSPAARSITVTQGSAAPGDNATVTLAGTNAGSSAWSAAHTSAPWLALATSSGFGSGLVTWNRNTTALAVGTYVDTIVVTVAASGQSARVFDTVRVTAVAAPPPPPPPTLALNPHGRRTRALRFTGGSNLIGPDADSAMVQATVFDTVSTGGWSASVSSGRLVLATMTGAMNTYVKWSRGTQPADPGLYVDTVAVVLQRDNTVRAIFLDSLEVVAVSTPAPDAAVGDLFDHGSLTNDQRDALDRQGNANGRYDLGDFLAWVNRNHIRLSASAALKMKQAMLVPGGGS